MKLKEIVTIQAGHPFRGKITESKTGEHFVVQMKDVSPDGALGELDWENLTCTELQGRKAPVWLSQGDTLFVARGGRNHAVYINHVPKPVVCAQLFFLLRIEPQVRGKIQPEFITWLINNRQSQRYFEVDAQGVTQSYAQRNITRGVLEEMPVIMPPLEEQRKIVFLFETAKRERQAHLALIDNRQYELNAITTQFYQQFDKPAEGHHE
ncbi:MAG: restriction endonuclease subunit S [Algicola sp.]|nr:restriction endonuclease subunit S [Algicola sp.]